ncbi:hypothetical protein [Haloarcula nitratireducens]|uniref:Uncharacterized protein n=1 Tax=Haloarcula nitratireducens TaxID=2487749 RepID=A0AAW4PGE1_9EURY|nr:hypothetical protein [Halomicroarcula nitratireducens]MBX0296894.1 hypothetical protein [Halomicroarcula nitratireducens]
MTGFKSGASNDDPLGSSDTEHDEAAEADERQQQETVSHDSANDEMTTSTETQSSTVSGLPWLYSRSSITDGREKTVQLHLQQSTLDLERAARRDIEIDDTVKKADLREAAVIVALDRHLEDVADKLREWGYDAE